MKTCTECKLELPIENFVWRNKKLGTRASKCTECRCRGQRESYYKHQEKNINRVKKRNKTLREWFVELKSNLFCIICGENEKCCLDFHHKNPEEKDYNISHMNKARHSKKRIIEEIEKCVVLCANCHRKFHNGILMPQW